MVRINRQQRPCSNLQFGSHKEDQARSHYQSPRHGTPMLTVKLSYISHTEVKPLSHPNIASYNLRYRQGLWGD